MDGCQDRPAGSVDVEVVVPLRWQDESGSSLRRGIDMGQYLGRLLLVTPYVTVVDGSDRAQFHRHRATCA